MSRFDSAMGQARSLFCANNQNGTYGVAHDRLGDTTQKQPLNSAASVAADYDQVRGPVFSCFHDLGGRLANMNEFKRRRLHRRAPTECGKESSAILLRESDKLACRNPR